MAAAAGALKKYADELQADGQAWKPTASDAFTALVVMVPTMSEYFGQWKESRFVRATPPRARRSTSSRASPTSTTSSPACRSSTTTSSRRRRLRQRPASRPAASWTSCGSVPLRLARRRPPASASRPSRPSCWAPRRRSAARNRRAGLAGRRHARGRDRPVVPRRLTLLAGVVARRCWRRCRRPPKRPPPWRGGRLAPRPRRSPERARAREPVRSREPVARARRRSPRSPRRFRPDPAGGPAGRRRERGAHERPALDEKARARGRRSSGQRGSRHGRKGRRRRGCAPLAARAGVPRADPVHPPPRRRDAGGCRAGARNAAPKAGATAVRADLLDTYEAPSA